MTNMVVIAESPTCINFILMAINAYNNTDSKIIVRLANYRYQNFATVDGTQLNGHYIIRHR